MCLAQNRRGGRGLSRHFLSSLASGDPSPVSPLAIAAPLPLVDVDLPSSFAGLKNPVSFGIFF